MRNQKYSVFLFLPIVFYEQFKFFFNFYFLVVALSQFIPALKIGESLQDEVADVRLHCDLRRPSGLRPGRHHGQGSI